jgi:two-component system nitrogen regulation response regulator NtrX
MTHQPHRILVVDDVPDWRTTLSRLLTDEGYEVQVAGSMESALVLLKTVAFDLALVDIRLDDSDETNVEGLDLADAIRRDWPTVKVLIITGYPTLETVERAMQPHGTGPKLAEGYIEKDRSHELVKMIQQVLGA